MLDIKIFNVDRGFCAAVNLGEHHTILIDSGYNSLNGFKASKYLLQQHCKTLDCLILPTYTEDHLVGLSDLVKDALGHIPINLLVANPSINPENYSSLDAAIRRFGNALTLTTDWHPECGKISQTMNIQDVNITFFWNNYPDFKDAHNLSLVTFISYRDINIIFPSDLEVEGWQALLKCDDFRDRLRRVNMFVAADHGQEEGYCPEVFDCCRPELIIVSNESNQRISPQMLNQYQKHSKGSPYGICDQKLLTTYDNGTITISKFLDRLRQVTPQYSVVQP
jgi:beta-lactamase superfamily II metal-dependent hydrolase